MGGSSWSDSLYTARAATHKSMGTTAFAHDDSIKSGKAAATAHESMSPAKLKSGKREARDSDEHPESNPVFVGLDVTGSMQGIPKQIQAKLPLLMGLLTRRGYLVDPAICVSAIGDVKFDSVPLQLGQFESGIEVDNDISNIFMEGGGGGNKHESYELALYFLARCVETDAWDKRQKKGYAFIICDEELNAFLLRDEVGRVFGDGHGLESDMPVEQLLEEVLQRWELYVIIPKMACHASDPSYSARWRALLGERVLMLDDPKGISEMIASTIGVLEDNVDVDSLVSDLTSEGSSAETASSVTRALANVKPGGGDLSKYAGGDTGFATL